MRYHSRPVDSGQDGIHPQLFKVLKTHLHCEYKKPISAYSQALFASVEDLRRRLNKPVILDSGCGTGASTQQLATETPAALVIGIDKSSHRLARGGLEGDIGHKDNCLLVKMDLVDFWRLALRHHWRLKKHYILYPNPWPKPKHLLRRWHAHPVFPELLRLGGDLELRSNWRVYAEEFQATVEFISPDACKLEEFDAKTSISLFELKYAQSGHKLYRCCCALDNLVKNNLFIGGL
jgi:tRNA (guanine-N7-)-methyltransferase